jgi:transcriptional regulator with XRE-family HTH domain
LFLTTIVRWPDASRSVALELANIHRKRIFCTLDPKAREQTMTTTIGALIKQRREELKMTQTELGKTLGYRYGNFIGYLENGKAVFPVEKWEEYAEVLQVPKHAFLEILFQEKYPAMLAYIDFHPARKAADKNRKTQSGNR